MPISKDFALNFGHSEVADLNRTGVTLSSHPDIATNGTTDVAPMLSRRLTQWAAAGIDLVVANNYKYTISTNVTIPAGMTLRIERGAVFDIASGITLTIAGDLEVSGLYQVFSGSGTVSFTKTAQRWLTPEMWGAVGDGVATDTTAIQSAVTACPTRGVVYFSGIYLIAATITLKSDIQLLGSAGAVIKLKDASHAGLDSTTGMLSGSTVSNVTVENLTIDGNKANNTVGNTSKGSGLYFDVGINIVVDGVRIINCPRDGLTFKGATTQEVRISNCFIDGCGIAGMNGGEDLLLIAGKNYTISNSIFTNSLLRGIDIEVAGGSTIVDVTISNCISSNNNRGISINGATVANILITGSLFKSNTLEGILLSTASHITISGGCQSISNGTDGIRFSGTSNDNSITGCKIESNTSDGISGSTNRSLIASNIIQSNGAMGIDIDATSTETNVTGNIIRNNTTIGITSRIARGSVSGNTVIDNGTIGISGIDMDYSDISGNKVYSNGNAGIQLNRGRGMICAHNIVRLNDDDGIRLINTPTDSMVDGNNVLDNNQSGGSFDNIEATGTNCVIQNNICRQGTETNKPLRGIIIGSGTDNVVRNNDLASAGSSANFTDSGTTTIAYQNVGDDAVIVQHLTGTATYDPASIADGAQTNTTLTVTGASVGDVVSIGFSIAITAGAIMVGAVTAANTVTVTLVNHTGGVLDLASGTLRASVTKY